MIMRYADPFETLFAFQRALENRLSSDWLADTTAGTGTYPPINVFQQGDDLVAIIELPGVKGSQYSGEGQRDPCLRSKEYRLSPGGKSSSTGARFRGVRSYSGRSDADRS